MADRWRRSGWRFCRGIWERRCSPRLPCTGWSRSPFSIGGIDTSSRPNRSVRPQNDSNDSTSPNDLVLPVPAIFPPIANVFALVAAIFSAITDVLEPIPTPAIVLRVADVLLRVANVLSPVAAVFPAVPNVFQSVPAVVRPWPLRSKGSGGWQQREDQGSDDDLAQSPHIRLRFRRYLSDGAASRIVASGRVGARRLRRCDRGIVATGYVADVN